MLSKFPPAVNIINNKHPTRSLCRVVLCVFKLELRFCTTQALVVDRCTQSLSIADAMREFVVSVINKEKDHPKKDGLFLGGVGETRTLAPVTRPTPLAGAPRHQLEYYSVCRKIGCGEQPIRADLVVKKVWRRGRDSNPWLFRVTGFQDRLLKPLGHLSVQSTHIILALYTSFVKTKETNSKKYFQKYFKKLSFLP